MKRFFSTALLCAAVVSSVATSMEEDYPNEPAPSGDIAIGNFQAWTSVSPTSGANRSFSLSIPNADLPDVVSSQLVLRAEVQTAAGWSDASGLLVGSQLSGSMELFADSSNTYVETITLADPFAGCQVVGNLCLAEWEVAFDHTDGSQVVNIDYSLTATVVGPNTNVEIDSM